jgi:hypothetical protein
MNIRISSLGILSCAGSLRVAACAHDLRPVVLMDDYASRAGRDKIQSDVDACLAEAEGKRCFSGIGLEPPQGRGREIRFRSRDASKPRVGVRMTLPWAGGSSSECLLSIAAKLVRSAR